MRVKVFLFVFLSVLCLAESSVASETKLDNDSDDYSIPQPIIISDVQKKAFHLSSNIFSKYHYHKSTLDQISESALNDYLHALDYDHIYFLQSDIDAFQSYRNQLKNEVNNTDLSPAVRIFKTYQERASALNNWSIERLREKIDLNSHDVLITPEVFNETLDRPWRKSLAEIHAYQDKRIKDALIRLIMSGRTEEKAVEMLSKRYLSLNKRLNQMTAEDVFNFYMNAIAMNFDPHTNYLSPQNTEDFDINMKLSLEGIGATLTYKEGNISVVELVPGGPAYKSGKLNIKDQIIGVGEGKDGEIQDIVGMRLDKAVRLIRGKKGTTVRLLIEPASGMSGLKEISIVRDTINLEEQAAQAYVETIKSGSQSYKLGVIRLPSFYMDFAGARAGKKDYRSTSKDIEKLLKELEKEKVSGIVIDLRGNGGGSLEEVVKTVGLFVDGGPVVMVADDKGNIRVERNDKVKRYYTGPLAVMIDHRSASASEIFAGAIKDYHRGLIIGANSFGKGTVQTVVDLNRFARKDSPPLGDIKFTIAMFHRINGSSTQLKGVAPDVILPTALSLDEEGEKNKRHVLPWKTIPATPYMALNDVTDALVDELQQSHQQRMDNLPYLQSYQNYVRKIGENNRQNQWSLNINERRQIYKNWESYKKDYAAIEQQAIPMLKSDDKRKEDLERRNKFADTEGEKEDFIPDVGLFEGLHIMIDYINQQKNKETTSLNKAA